MVDAGVGHLVNSGGDAVLVVVVPRSHGGCLLDHGDTGQTPFVISLGNIHKVRKHPTGGGGLMEKRTQ